MQVSGSHPHSRGCFATQPYYTIAIIVLSSWKLPALREECAWAEVPDNRKPETGLQLSRQLSHFAAHPSRDGARADVRREPGLCKRIDQPFATEVVGVDARQRIEVTALAGEP